MNKINTKIISGFPGVGKTYFFNNLNNIKVIDSDSSIFSWIYTKNKKKRNPDFPKNYLEHIKSKMGNVDIILVSSHKEIRDLLEINNLKYYIIYPNISLKEEYLNRYRSRGNDDNFINLVNNNWNLWLKELQSQKNENCIELKNNQYLSDVIELIL